MPPVRVSGRFLALTGTFGRASEARAVAAQSAEHSSRPVPDLQISVPKRLVRSAVKRNTVKRVLREAWRAACIDAFPAEGRVWRFQLRAHPAGSLLAKSQYARAQMRAQARRTAERAALHPAGRTARQPVESTGLPSSGFAASKRQLRAEADALLADARKRLSQRRPRRVPDGAGR